VTLTWVDNATNETAYVVERKLPPPATAAWVELTGTLAAGTQTYADTTVPVANVHNYYFYRVRAKNGTTKSGAAEVATAGNTSTEQYDTDADGMMDADEATYGFDAADWTDGSGDYDGDGVPNAWEIHFGKNPLATSSTEYDATAIAALNSGVVKWVTVDPSQAASATNATTINSAIAKFPAGTSHNYDSYRVIRVKPGVYTENVSKAATVQANIAILPERSATSDVFEIRGASTGYAALSTYGGLVLDGFTLKRSGTTTGRLVSVLEEAVPLNRISLVRLVNCMAAGANTAAEPVVEQSRSRLIIAHCTFYANTCTSTSLSHSYSSGLLGATAPVESTARLKVQNSIFWNPMNLSVPEFQSAGDFQFTTSIMYQSPTSGMPVNPAGAENVNPGLTPKGFLSGQTSPAAIGGTVNGQVRVDMHGEVRFTNTGRGADEWDDADEDGIPNFADVAPSDASNAFVDSDGDLLSQLTEYLTSSDYFVLDNPYESLSLIYYTKAESEYLFFTKAESNARFLQPAAAHSLFLTEAEADARYRQRSEVLRVQPQGGLSMGEFTNGVLP
jgi:hypothetical protein